MSARRRRGGGLAITTLWGWNRRIIMRYPPRKKNKEGDENGRSERTDRFAGKDVLAQ